MDKKIKILIVDQDQIEGVENYNFETFPFDDPKYKSAKIDEAIDASWSHPYIATVWYIEDAETHRFKMWKYRFDSSD